MRFMGVNVWAVLVSALATMVFAFVVCASVDDLDGLRSG